MIFVHFLVLFPLLFGAYFWPNIDQFVQQQPIRFLSFPVLSRQKLQPGTLSLLLLPLALFLFFLRAAVVKSSTPPVFDVEEISAQNLVIGRHLNGSLDCVFPSGGFFVSYGLQGLVLGLKVDRRLHLPQFPIVRVHVLHLHVPLTTPVHRLCYIYWTVIFDSESTM